MLRLKSHNTSPPSGFSFIDKASGFKAHGWSVRSTAAQWYHEQLKRGQNRSVEDCISDVERFTCEELMKTPHWNQWVMVTVPPMVPLPPVIERPLEANISVVIPIYERSERAYKCINSVKDQSSEVVVVMNDHERIIVNPEVVIEDPKIKYVYTETNTKDLGFGEKCNLGAKNSDSPYIWFLNDDCYPSPGCASQLLNVLTANPKIGMVGHLLRYPDGRIQHAGTERCADKVGFPHRDVGLYDPTIKVPTEMEAVTAASVMVRREAFEAVGGFDEGYFMYLEDSDLCLKMRSAGWKVYFTPFAEAIHEEHASSKLRPDLDQILQKSVERFKGKWDSYFSNPPPQFQSFKEVSNLLKIDAVYVHLVGHEGYEKVAQRFVESVVKYPPGQDLNWVIVCNSDCGNQLSDHMKSVFSHLGNVTYFRHDNSGWDIGGFQAYSKTSQADLCVFFGSTAYMRKKNWAHHMVTSFQACGPDAIYGTHGNMGDQNVRVSPHFRTTGFWCSPKILNGYPHIARTPQDRYPIEHGPNCLTLWCWSQGYQVYIVDTEHIYAYPDWDNGPEGFHRGTQNALIFGDRLTQPPYYSHE